MQIVSGLSPAGLDVKPMVLDALADLVLDVQHTYEVGEIDGIPFLYRTGPDPLGLCPPRFITNPFTINEYVLNTPKGKAMTEAFDTIRPEDQYSAEEVEDLDAAAALIASYDPSQGAPFVQRIGARARSMRETLAAGRYWANVDHRDTGRMAVVGLDTDPEVPGKPRNSRPGVPQLHLVELPEDCHLYTGDGSVAVLYYVPVTTYMFDKPIVDRLTGEIIGKEPTLCASQNDYTGYTHVVKTMRFTSAEDAETWAASIRNAVKLLAGANVPEPDEADIEADEEEKARRLRQRMTELSRL